MGVYTNLSIGSLLLKGSDATGLGWVWSEGRRGMLTTWDLAVGRTGSTLTPLIAATHQQSSFWLHTFLPSVGIMTYVNNDSSSVNIKLKNWSAPRLLHHVCVLRRFDWHNNDWEVGFYDKIKVAVVWTDYHQIQSGGTNSKMIREINEF